MKKLILILIALFYLPSAFSQSYGGAILQCYTGGINSTGYASGVPGFWHPTHLYPVACYYIFPSGGGNTGGGSGSTGGGGPVATVIPVGGTGQVRTEESCTAPISVIRQAARDGAEAALGRAPVDGDQIQVFSDAADSYGRSRTFRVAGTQYVPTEGSCGVAGSGSGGGGGGGGYIP